MGNQGYAVEETKNLNTMPFESLVNSLTELKFKSKVQDEEEARAKRSIGLKASQEEEDLYSIDKEEEDVDEGDISLITKGIKKYFINKRLSRRGGISNYNNKNKVK